jgi:hypothetical protein
MIININIIIIIIIIIKEKKRSGSPIICHCYSNYFTRIKYNLKCMDKILNTKNSLQYFFII